MSGVDWTDYAREYDLLMVHSPPYQELLAHCTSTFASIDVPARSVIADFGGGTGNFSIALAIQHPSATVLHVERDPGMLDAAIRKAKSAGLRNWAPLEADIEKPLDMMPRLYGAVCVNALYTCQNPAGLVDRVSTLLAPGGLFYACDLGRPMRVLDWAIHLISRSLVKNGVAETLHLIRSTRRVREQNRIIATLQRRGQFWLHTLPEFVRLFEAAGLEILSSSSHLYRGYNDLVVARCRQRAISVERA